MPHFFISYAKKDTRALALALSDALNALPNITAWVDRSLKAGKSWELQIQTEIDKCDYFVVLYSPDINRHKQGQDESYVLTEIAYAKYELKKPIIPVMAQATTPPMSLTTLHYIDYTLSGLTLDDLLEAICAEAGIKIKIQSVIAAIPSVSITSSKSLLPEPFDWCEIPIGKVKFEAGGYLRKDTIFEIPAFLIAKYPVTNAQYKLFIDDGGYQNESWWTKEGWRAKEEGWYYDGSLKSSEKAWTQPLYWHNPVWIRSEQPVVGVSAHEAIAFCFWLSEKTGEKIQLPTEQEWQRAAQGDDGRAYPWGNDFDKTKANTKESDLGVTTAVSLYSNGLSPFGVYDMAGNVWEWCLTDWTSGKQESNIDNTRPLVLRGGSWSYNRINARVGSRLTLRPSIRNYDYGFRIVRLPE